MIEMLGHEFVRNALIAGTAIAVVSGLTGYFLVLRAQVFTVDALGHVAVTGALAALALGVDVRIGLFVATLAVGQFLGVLGRRGRADDVVIGSVFAWVLGLGALFLSIVVSTRGAGDSTAGIAVLFGSVFGLTSAAVVIAVAIAAVVAVAMVVVARPLLFATLDEAVADSRGVRVTALAFVFLALVALTAAEASQAVGALLLLGLIAGPGATAARVTARPYRAMAVAAGCAVAAVWVGVTLSYAVPQLPPSFSILAVVTLGYAATWPLSWRGSRAVVAGD